MRGVSHIILVSNMAFLVVMNFKDIPPDILKLTIYCYV